MLMPAFLLAGTRFLKRGCDFNGRPANSVETEQILHDGSTTHHGSGKYTSWLQMRASVPCFWSQDLSTKIKRVKMHTGPTTQTQLGDADGVLPGPPSLSRL